MLDCLTNELSLIGDNHFVFIDLLKIFIFSFVFSCPFQLNMGAIYAFLKELRIRSITLVQLLPDFCLNVSPLLSQV